MKKISTPCSIIPFLVLIPLSLFASKVYFIENIAECFSKYRLNWNEHTTIRSKPEVDCVVCNAPNMVTLANIPNEVEIDWPPISNAAYYKLEIGPKGFAPGTGASTIAFNNINGSFKNVVGGLEPNTDYEVYIQTICSNGETSLFSEPVGFTSFPSCGDNFNFPGGINGGHFPLDSYGYVICPEVTGEYVQLVFHEMIADTCLESLLIQNNSSTLFLAASSNIDYPLTITSNAADGCLSVLLLVNDDRASCPGWNVSMNCLPCPPPSELFIQQVTSDEIQFGWIAINSPLILDWEIVPFGFSPDSGMAVSEGQTNLPDLQTSASGLASNTAYELYTRILCQQDTGTYSEPIPFRTAPVCGEVFYDSGGPDGDYFLRNQTSEMIICPDEPSQGVEVNFIEFQTSPNHQLLIHNANNASGSFEGSFSGGNSPGKIVSTHSSGCLTFRFNPLGGIPLTGWEAPVSCLSCPPIGGLKVLSSAYDYVTLGWNSTLNAASYDWEVGLPGFAPDTGSHLSKGNTATTSVTVAGLESSTVYELYVRVECDSNEQSYFSKSFKFSTNAKCGDVFYDAGGPNAPYGNNENIVTTICPDNDTQLLTVVFNLFNTPICCDRLNVYHGSPSFIGTNPFLLLSGSVTPDPIEAEGPGKCLTFEFISDVSGIGNGWEANILCTPSTTTSTDEKGMLQNSFKVFPNPTSSSLSVFFESPLMESAVIEVRDVMGRLVLEKTWMTVTGTNQTVLEISELAPGTYLVVLKGEYGGGSRSGG